MVTFSEYPKTLDEIQATIRKHLGDPGRKKPRYTFDCPSRTSNRLCFVSYATSAVRYELEPDLLQIVAKSWRLHLNLESFFVETEFAKDKFCLWIETHPNADNRHFTPFYANSRRLNIRHSIPAFCAHSGDSKTICLPRDRRGHGRADGLHGGGRGLEFGSGNVATHRGRSFLAAKFRGLKRKQQMLEATGGALTSEKAAEILGISRQAVDKRRAANQLLALTQGRRGYSYPSFQFEDGKTITGLEEVLGELKELDPWMQMVFFTSSNERLGDKTPLEELEEGLVSEVKAAAAGYGEQGAV